MTSDPFRPSAPPHPSQALDDEPDFDISLQPTTVHQWHDALGRVAQVGLSRQLHQLLRAFDPNTIGESPGPYSHRVVSECFGRYIVSRKSVLMDPTQRGFCIAGNDVIGLMFGSNRFPWNDMHKHLRRHLVLLNVTN